LCSVLGKAEGRGENWHGHVTAVTVAPEFRRLGIARKLMNLLELVSEKMYPSSFIVLIVLILIVILIETQ
jgi:N-terminal acetyltransferase B complex catalytic subunit